MAVKTFTDNTSLPASDINTFLANSGLVYIGTVTYSAAGAVSANNVFTSTYRNYVVVGSHNPSNNLANFNVRLRAGGTDQTGANYQYTSARLYTNNAQDSFGSGANFTQMSNGGVGNAIYAYTITFYSPQISDRTIWCNDAVNFEGASAGVRWWSMGGYNATYQADGFTLYPGSGTWTGQLQIYGYRIP